MYCFLCVGAQTSLPGGLHELKCHLISEHDIKFQGGNSKGPFLCKENDCNRKFNLFSSYSRHVHSAHSDCLNVQMIAPSNEALDSDIIMADVPCNLSDPLLEEIPENEDDYMTFEQGKDLINQIICEIRCKTSIPESVVSYIVDGMIKAVVIISIFVQGRFLKLMKMLNIDVNGPPVIMFLNCLDFTQFFKNTETFAKQIKHNLQNLDYIAPQEIFLGQRVDTVIKNNMDTTKVVKETFQYFSIIKTLKSIFKFTKIKTIIEAEAQNANGEIYDSYKDGSEFSSHPFLEKHKNAVRINLYYDDVEVANPIGSKSAVYKIAAFYFTIQNASFHNSKLDNIFILALCYNTDVKKYGFDKILRPFIEEMKQLESDEGVEMYFNGEIIPLRAIFVSFLGDSLAAHDILGFSGPSSTRFCRQCMITRKEFHENPLFRAESRTKTNHNRQLEHLEATDYSKKTIKLYGVKENSPLNELRYFHVSSNCTFDPMHDLLEGVVPMTIKEVLKYFILERKLFSSFQLNDRIDRFRYGVCETKNKPSADFTNAMLSSSNSNKLKQKSAQCWLLLRVFAFLVGPFLEESDFVYLELTSKLIKICSIAFSPEVSLYLACDLNETVTEFLLQFNTLFGQDIIQKNGIVVPGKKMINKCHHLTHFAENILLKGPTAQYSCMRFESKHFPVKQQIASAHNYVNVPYSIAKRQSLLQAFNIKHNSFRYHVPMLKSFKIVDINELPCADLITSQFGPIQFIKRISECKINNVDFRPNFVIRIERIDDFPFPQYAIIKHIFEFNNKIWFHCKKLRTIDIDDIYYSFEVEESSESIIIDQTSFDDFFPCNIWRKHADDRKYVSIKYSF
jgi:hypothetical protein